MQVGVTPEQPGGREHFCSLWGAKYPSNVAQWNQKMRLGKLLAFLMRWIKVFSQTHLYDWIPLSERSLKDYVERKLLWVITRSFVLKTCVFLLHCNYRGWGLDFHFVLASCWGLTWSLPGGWRCDCSTLEQDRHSGLPVQTLFLIQPADFYLF